jgi:hypothetical protein
VREIRSDLPVTELSAKTGQGMGPWLAWLQSMVAERQAKYRRHAQRYSYAPQRQY